MQLDSITQLAVTIGSFVVILVFLMIAHELGHFMTAKAFGVKVEEFGLGLPPRIWGFQRGETVYSLNWVPFGAFVKLLGEEDPQAPRSLAGKSRKVRFLVLVAGSLMNIVLPILLFSIAFMVPHQALMENVQIKEVLAGSPAESAGMAVGDTVLQINGQAVNNRNDVGYYLRLNLGSPVTIVLRTAAGAEKTVHVVPRWNPPPGQGATGIVIEAAGSRVVSESDPFWVAIPKGAVRCWETLVLFRNTIAIWIIGTEAPQLTGPVGIAQMTGEVVQAGWGPILEFTALISLNLGIVNLLPIPGLDGGRLIFVILEFLRRGKRISAKREGLIHFVGLVGLLLMIAIISYFDIVRLVSGGSVLP